MQLDVLLTGMGFPRLGSSATLLRWPGQCILVDSGPGFAADRLLAALDDQGVVPEEVDWIVTTHLHYDHCGNHLRFPRARFLVNEQELADGVAFLEAFDADPTPTKEAAAARLRNGHQAVKEFYVRSMIREVKAHREFYDRILWGDPRFVPVRGALTWSEGVQLIPTPGHTRGHMSLVAQGVVGERWAGGADVLVAGDAVFDDRGLDRDDGDLPLVVDADAYRANRRQLLNRYRWLVPGHGGLVENPRATAWDAIAATVRPPRIAAVGEAA